MKKEAKIITLSPAREGTTITTAESMHQGILDRLLGEVIKKDDEISLKDKKETKKSSRADDFFESFHKNFEEFGNIWTGIRFKVISTVPEGDVEVTQNTKLELISELPNEDGFSKSRVIEIKTSPDLKNLIETKSIDDIKKLLVKFTFVNKYEDKKEVIYFSDKYFYRIDKK